VKVGFAAIAAVLVARLTVLEFVAATQQMRDADAAQARHRAVTTRADPVQRMIVLGCVAAAYRMKDADAVQAHHQDAIAVADRHYRMTVPGLAEEGRHMTAQAPVEVPP
jgi:hypothetical protein